MDCANTLHQVRRNSQMVHERVSLQIIQVFGLVDFFDHSIDCFYKYSSGISPAVSDWFFQLQQSGLIGQRCSLCGQVFIYEDSLAFVNAVVPLQLSARRRRVKVLFLCVFAMLSTTILTWMSFIAITVICDFLILLSLYRPAVNHPYIFLFSSTYFFK